MYLYSNAYRVKTKISIGFNQNDHISERVFTGVKIAFIGVFLVSLNVIVNHFSILLFPQYQAYFWVGFEAYFSIFGFSLLLIGISLFNYFFVEEVSNNGIISNRTILTIFPLLFLMYVGFSNISYLIDPIFAFTSVNYSTLLFVGIIAVVSYHFLTLDFKYNITKLRYHLSICINLALSLILLLSIYFVPDPNLPPEEHLTKRNTIEIYLFSTNLFSVIISILLLLVTNIPDWLQDMYEIEDTEIEEQLFEKHGVESPNLVQIKAEDIKTNDWKLRLDESLDQGFLVFENIEDKKTKIKLIETIKNQTDILDEFQTENLNDKYFLDDIKNKSNQIILTNELDEYLVGLLDGIMDIYNWDITTRNGKLTINSFPYQLPSMATALIFSGKSVWNPSFRTYLFLFDQKLNKSMVNFVDNYFNYLEELSFESPYILILFFEKLNGEILDIKPQNNDSNIPNNDNIEIIKFSDRIK